MEILKLFSIQIFYTVKGFKYYLIDELGLKFNKYNQAKNVLRKNVIRENIRLQYRRDGLGDWV